MGFNMSKSWGKDAFESMAGVYTDLPLRNGKQEIIPVLYLLFEEYLSDDGIVIIIEDSENDSEIKVQAKFKFANKWLEIRVAAIWGCVVALFGKNNTFSVVLKDLAGNYPIGLKQLYALVMETWVIENAYRFENKEQAEKIEALYDSKNWDDVLLADSLLEGLGHV